MKSPFSTTHHFSRMCHDTRVNSILIIACSICISCVIYGCDNSPSKPSDQPRDEQATANTTRDDEHCNSVLDSVFNMVQPDRLGISSDIDSAVTVLNEWHGMCGGGSSTDGGELLLSDELKRLIPEDYRSDLAASRFLSRDLLHVRNCLLFRKMAYDIAARSDDELSRIVEIFYYVMRNVSLPDPSELMIPVPPYEVCIFGKGSPEDRAWVFAELLRQLNIDAVIIRPDVDKLVLPAVEEKPVAKKDDEGFEQVPDDQDTAKVARREPFLVGVILRDDVYLFDTFLGLPIPSQADVAAKNVLVLQPATWSETLADAGILDELTTDSKRPYPITMASLSDARFELIGDVGLWAPRMRILQDSLSGDRTVLIYDPLENRPDATGLASRVAGNASIAKKSEDLSIWDYPETTLRQAEALIKDETYRQQYGFKRFALEAPVEVVNDSGEGGNNEVLYGPPTARSLKTRIQQLMGNYKEAVTSYVTVKLDCINVMKDPRMPQELKLMHAWAFDDASYWIALSQWEQGDLKSAENSLRSYRKNPSASRWIVPSIGAVSIALARSGKFFGAVDILEGIPDDTPQKAGYNYLLKRWKAIRDSSTNTESTKSTPTSEK